MTIVDAQGRERAREFVILRRDVRKMVYMVWKHTDRDDDRWVYLPALDLVKRIAASDERTSFAGSYFYYEDVSGRGTEEDAHELVETTDKHYVLNNVPKDPKAVEFASCKLWIDKQTFMPTRAEYLDKDGKQYRAGEAFKVRDEEPDDCIEDDEIAIRIYRNISGYEVAVYGYHGSWRTPAGVNPATGHATLPDLSVVGANLFLGAHDHTFSGTFERNTNAYAGLRYRF